MAVLITLRVFAINLLRGNRRKILFVFCFNAWSGFRTLALRLIRQHTTYQTTVTSEICWNKNMQVLRSFRSNLTTKIKTLGFKEFSLSDKKKKKKYHYHYYSMLIHNWQLQPFSQDYGLASQITHVVCINSVRKWQDVQSTPNNSFLRSFS